MSIERSKYKITKLAEFDKIVATDGLHVEGGQVFIKTVTESSSTETGALRIEGGIGLGKKKFDRPNFLRICLINDLHQDCEKNEQTKKNRDSRRRFLSRSRSF